MARWFEFLFYGGSSLLFGWFAPRIFLNTKWEPSTRLLFTAVLTIAMFLLLGIFHLNTGEDFGDYAVEKTLCPWLALSHCPQPRSASNSPASSSDQILPTTDGQATAGVPTEAPPAATPQQAPADTGAQSDTTPSQSNPADGSEVQTPDNGGATQASPQPVTPPPDTASPQLESPKPSQSGTSQQPAEEPSGDTPSASQPAPEDIKPHSAERYGISVILDGLTETRDRYIATIRIVNSSSTDANIALLSSQWSTADFFLADTNGGSCQMAANGEGWGSLGAIIIGSMNLGGHYALIPANGEARHFIFFNKMRCPFKLTATTDISLNGTFILSNGLKIPVSFSDLAMNSK